MTHPLGWLAAAGVLLHFLPEAAMPGAVQAGAALLLASVALGSSGLSGRGGMLAAGVLAWSALSLAWSVDVGQSAFTVALWTGFLAVPLLSRTTRSALLMSVVTGVLLCVVMSAWQLLVGFPDVLRAAHNGLSPDQERFAREWAERGRVLGSFNSPDALAAVLVTTVPACLIAARQRAIPVLRIAGWIAVTTGMAALLLTQSVGGVLAFTGAVVLVAGARLQARGSAKAAAGLVGAAAIPAIVVVTVRLRSAGEPLGLSVRERLEDWANAVRMLGQRPLGGVGAGAFESAFNAWSPQGRRYSAIAHQAVLQAGVELGVIAMIALAALYLGLVLWAVKRARSGSWREAVMAVGVVAGCAHHQVDYTLHIAGGVGLAIAVALLRMQRARRTIVLAPAWRAGLVAGVCALAWLGSGAALCERGIPRTRDDGIDVERTARGAHMLWFDARAQVALADDLYVMAAREGLSLDILRAHQRAARQAAIRAPWHPQGPMQEARMLATARDFEAALGVYDIAISRACCSRKLHEERAAIAGQLGRQDVVALDEAWLHDH